MHLTLNVCEIPNTITMCCVNFQLNRHLANGDRRLLVDEMVRYYNKWIRNAVKHNFRTSSQRAQFRTKSFHQFCVHFVVWCCAFDPVFKGNNSRCNNNNSNYTKKNLNGNFISAFYLIKLQWVASLSIVYYIFGWTCIAFVRWTMTIIILLGIEMGLLSCVPGNKYMC